MLTNEDHMIFRARMSVAAQAKLHKAHRVEAQIMRNCDSARRQSISPKVRIECDQEMHAVTAEPLCACVTGGEWSGSPSDSHPDTHWVCDNCGREHSA